MDRKQFDRECLAKVGRILRGKLAHWCHKHGRPVDETCPEILTCDCDWTKTTESLTGTVN